MLLEDILYGEFEVDDVVEELIKDSAMQRLKKIHQAGPCYLYDCKYSQTRYDHSIGVMLLIRKLGGTLEEQIAGLLHDISHTAFSHSIDYVLDNREEDYHEKIKEEVVNDSKIKDILHNYGFDSKSILDDEQWSLLEQPLPALCVDRIDYTLRDLYYYFNEDIGKIHHLVHSFKVVNQVIVIAGIQEAEYFTELFFAEVIDFFQSPYNKTVNEYLTTILKDALHTGVITLKDFRGTDESLLDKIRTSHDESLISGIDTFKENVDILIRDRHTSSIHLKKRCINPLVLIDGKVKEADKVSKRVKELNQRYG